MFTPARMPESEENLITSYCMGLVSAFKRLSQDLYIPQIDQDLYADLLIRPFKEQQCGREHPSSPTSTSISNTNASDGQAEELVALGGTELIVTALRAHEQRTLQVLQAIALRESVMTRMRACCDTFDRTTTSASEEARFTFLRLLQEHQLVTLLTVECIFEWREMLSRPYPFLLNNGDNYLQSIIRDCVALDRHALVRSLANVRLRQDPLCSRVDLKRMLHRLETMRRSRLITTGALWDVGLRPLQPLPERSSSRSADVRRPPRAASAKSNNSVGPPVGRASGPIPRTPPRTAVKTSGLVTRDFSSKGEDFDSEMTRLKNALQRMLSGRGGSISQSSATTSPPSRRNGSATRRSHAPQPPPLRDGAEARRRQQHRLLTAACIIEKEAELQRKVVEELYELAYVKQRFVPLLDIPHLFINAGEPAAHGAPLTPPKGDYPADSWPLDREQWPALVTAEKRVDRLSCISAAREALQASSLLPAWQRRMGRRVSDISMHLAALSKASAASAHSLAYSDSMEHPSAASLPGLAMDTRRPMMAVAEQSSLSSSVSSSFSASASNTSGELAEDLKGSGGQTRKAAASPAHSESFSSDFESESDTSKNSASDSAASAKGAGGRSLSHHSSNDNGESNNHDAPPSASPASSITPSSSYSSSASRRLSHRLSLDQLREQLLAEHSLNSRSRSHSL
ncbi:hypothetical protein ABL78_0739 [Leptomonas seymouri]|uniref:Uncharacterized protein n=1 Tax=Leptomonas seymouri TaxID=5684 RepID=A0A0N1I1K7_LEPSE|nr:hypothetical protein ABL78_0739 [Leptomonas seymouri]|eukprot:KPI90094.1 hypothetical protein ABL78_0739 [Leptomonas seymouri]